METPDTSFVLKLDTGSRRGEDVSVMRAVGLLGHCSPFQGAESVVRCHVHRVERRYSLTKRNSDLSGYANTVCGCTSNNKLVLMRAREGDNDERPAGLGHRTNR